MTAWLFARVRLIGLVVGMLTLLGAAAFLTMARQEDPGFPYRVGLITVTYAGATAEAVERLVVHPLSDELSQVEEIDDFTTTVRAGVALVNIDLRESIYATDAAWDRVRQAMERARLEFPDGVDIMSLDDRQIDIPAVVLAVHGDPSLAHLSREAERLKRALADLPGVSRIVLEGDVNDQIVIALRDADLRALGLTPDLLSGLLADRNRMIPGGFIVTGDTRLGILPNSELVNIEALRATQIPVGDGSVPLVAIADIWRAPGEPAQPQAWFDGEAAVLVTLITERGQVDAIRFGEELRTRLESLRTDFQPLRIDEMFFQPDQVKQRLDSLVGSLVISLLIIVAVVFAGMGWRMGVVVASMLPLVALISLGLYNLGGGILHQIAVIGMVISLGMLIDNAIVMVENIQVRLDLGTDRNRAMTDAVRELAGPLGASTGTTLAAFMPLLLSSGATADFTRGIPVMIMLTLSVSYLLAVGVAPLFAARFLKPATRSEARTMVWLSEWLARLGTRRPVWMMLLGLSVMAGSLALAPLMKQQFFPNADRPQVVVELYLPEGTDQGRTADVAAGLEAALRERPRVIRVHRFVGSTGPTFYYNLPRTSEAPNRARLVVKVDSLDDTGGVIEWVRAHVADTVPEANVIATTLGQGPQRVAPVEIRIYDPDEGRRVAAAEQVFALLKRVPGTADVRHDIDLGVPTIAIDVDDAQAARFGLTRADVARALHGLSLGTTVEQYRQERDPIPILLRSHDGTRQSIERLASLDVFNRAGDGVPLTALARLEPRWLPAAIHQRNGVRVLTVTAGLENGAGFDQVLDALKQALQAHPLPAGTRIEFGGDSEGSGDANRAIVTTAPVGILLLLFFLLLQFNSYRRVGVILLTVPMAGVGVIPGLVLSGSPFGFQSLLGVIALVGIVVNNAIVLIDRIDQRLAEGDDIADAVADAVRRRTRPILLTTATTIVGLLPLAFSASTLWPPMAWAIISGLMASTILTLLVVPAVCRVWLAPRPQTGTNARLAVGAIVITLAGCTPFDHIGPDSPRALSALSPMEPPPRVALVLSSGGPRGYAHIGVMRVLEEAGIEIDLIVGTSVGSLLGAFWADGRSATEIDAISRDGGPLTLFDLSPFADRGWIHGQRLQDFVNTRLGNKTIEQLPRRLVVGATRREDKAPVFFTSGNVGVAVRASSAVPGIISPVGIQGTEYEDGDESLPLAVSAARQAGARFVIAVDVTPRPATAPPNASPAQLERATRRRGRIEPEAVLADYVIHADLDFGAAPTAGYFLYARVTGEGSARMHLPSLLSSLERAGLACAARDADAPVDPRVSGPLRLRRAGGPGRPGRRTG